MSHRFYRELALLGLGICLAYLAAMHFGITCPIRYLTGISCPGCGMTRAWLQLLQGHWQAAFTLHPLWGLPVVLAVLLLLRRRLSRRLQSWIWAALLAVTLTVWLVRFFLPADPAVQFAPASGLFGRILSAHIY